MDFTHDVIAWKRDGNELDEPRVRAFVEGVVSGAVPSYQASALLMAMVLRGRAPVSTRQAINASRSLRVVFVMRVPRPASQRPRAVRSAR